MQRAIVCGAGGFIGSHLARELKKQNFWVRGVDLKFPEFSESECDEFILGDLRDPSVCASAFNGNVDEVYQLAADMGGAGYIFTGDNDADILHNSALINLNALKAVEQNQIPKIFYSSSACVYPEHNQLDSQNPICTEDSVYPAAPDSEYGWEKLFSERLYLSFQRNKKFAVRIARFHNIFGEEGSWQGGREKAPAAICRKVAVCDDGGEIEMWGNGLQTRSFLHIDDCIQGVLKLMRSDWSGPVNIGSEEMVSINQLAEMTMQIAQKTLTIRHVEGPEGVRGRNSDNTLIQAKLGWEPDMTLEDGLKKTYPWIAAQVAASAPD